MAGQVGLADGPIVDDLVDLAYARVGVTATGIARAIFALYGLPTLTGAVIALSVLNTGIIGLTGDSALFVDMNATSLFGLACVRCAWVAIVTGQRKALACAVLTNPGLLARVTARAGGTIFEWLLHTSFARQADRIRARPLRWADDWHLVCALSIGANTAL